MSTATPQDTAARIRRSLRRSAVLAWSVGVLSALCGIGVAASPALLLGRAEGSVIRVEFQKEVIAPGNPQAGEMVWFEEVVVAYPVVEYPVGDQKHTLRSSSSLSVGDKVPVLYKTDRPGVATIDTFTDRWAAPLAIGGIQLLLGVAIVAAAVHSGRMFRQFEALIEGPGQAAPSQQDPSKNG
jgi:hypothetical protein